ncbi:MAG: DUF1549 domain-containing protein, partial [Lentisphaeraceae bacterium]|nr:DUF1549 domain-containing protein [Lentisphaeraceae bacterium]
MKMFFTFLLGMILSSQAEIPYQLYEPENLDKNKKYPLVIYLHGSGAKGDDNQKPSREPFVQMMLKKEVRDKFPCFLLVPQCKKGTDVNGLPFNWVNWEGQDKKKPAKWEKSLPGMSSQLKLVQDIFSRISTNASIDKSRVYLSGVSMGGSGTWYWSAAHPKQFAGIIAVCGLSETEKAPKYKDVAIQIFHGEKDAVVPYQRSLDMYTALKKNGANALIYEFKNKGHNIARELFNGKDLSHLEWLFKQKKNVQSAGKNSGFFKQQVLPILEDKCIRCHGEKKQKGDFRLDSRAAILKGGGSGAVINFHKPQSSLFIHAISHEDAELAMPPKKKMEDSEIEILTKWIKEGLHWPGQMDTVVEKTEPDEFITDEMKNHWAFQPLKKVTVPEVEWGNNPIDKFLFQAMKKKGLNPQKDASKNILARRLYYNLTGLPPTLEQLNSFKKEGIVDKVVDNLLSSKAYGEKWGRHWLDVARYADSNGSEVDHAMANAWRYRDYIIDSFNKDKPFNRFIKEQIAGDLIPDGGSEGICGTGFLMFGPKSLAELDKKKLELDVIDEQLDTIGKAFMGMTIGCARCHDHKFDPISHKDYYAMAGIFKSTRTINSEKRVSTWYERTLSPGDETKLKDIEKQISELEERKKKPLVAMPVITKNYTLIEAESFAKGNIRSDFNSLGKSIGVIRTAQKYPDTVNYEIEVSESGIYQLEFRYAAKESRPTEITLNGDLLDMNGLAQITGGWNPAKQKWFKLGEFQFNEGKNSLILKREGPIPIIDKILIGKVLGNGKLHGHSVKNIKSNSNKTAYLQRIDKKIEDLENELEKIPVVVSPQEGRIEDMNLLIRGNHKTPGEIVPRGFMKLLNPQNSKPSKKSSGRLELAEWISDDSNPLTARVIVNRVWHWHFGKGLVTSVDNFGLTGTKPDHPELLDWLTAEFIKKNWSIKYLNRLICTSQVYRLDSANKLPEEDLENITLSSFPQRRLTAEEIRDSLLLM